MTDADRFEAFIREYQDMVFATAVRLLGNPVDAEDVSQTVFLKAYERFDEMGTSPTVAGWLKTVTTNLCLNHLGRYRSRWRLFSELRRDDDEAGFEEGVPDTAVAGAALDEDDRRRQLEEALRRLPDSPARAARVVSLRRAELSADCRHAWCVAREGEG